MVLAFCYRFITKTASQGCKENAQSGVLLGVPMISRFWDKSSQQSRGGCDQDPWSCFWIFLLAFREENQKVLGSSWVCNHLDDR